MKKQKIILGLGSNIGDRMENLRSAISKLTNYLLVESISSIFESVALLPEGAVEDWNKPFYNMVLVVTSDMSPDEIISITKAIEEEMGRVKLGHWSPRNIDIDILLFDELVIKQDDLRIPHKEMLKRDFVLLPMVEVAGDFKYPQEGKYKGMAIADIVKEKGFKLGDTIAKIGKLHD
ncbi:MAG: 2-amino-4-hydroxy-6-hydroxymethyldihydropteridine diphosphokinase [Rickettsiales bacterium]